MYLNPTQIPQHLRQDYNNVANAYKKLLDDVQEYQTSLIPTYYSIPKYIYTLGVQMDHQEMMEFGELAIERSAGRFKVADTPIGKLFCFKEDLLDEVFDEFTDSEEDEDD